MLEAIAIERRQGDRGNTDLTGQPTAERRLVEIVAHRAVVHTLEVAAFTGQQLEARGGETLAELDIPDLGLFGSFPSPLEHLWRHVDPDDSSVGADSVGRYHRIHSGSRADVDNMLPRLGQAPMERVSYAGERRDRGRREPF